MPNDKFSPNELFEKIKKLSNAGEMPLVNAEAPEEYKIHIRPDTSVPRGLFVPDPLIPGGHKAHPVTIRAVRKDIFVVGDGTEDLCVMHTCHSCKRDIDLQFWQFCPYCEASFQIVEK